MTTRFFSRRLGPRAAEGDCQTGAGNTASGDATEHIGPIAPSHPPRPRPGLPQRPLRRPPHLQHRAKGGTNHGDNLITLCGAHHRAVHRGQLTAKPNDIGVIELQHAEGTAYGHIRRAKVIDRHPDLLIALRNLGFRSNDIHHALAVLGKDNALAGATLDQLLRAALQLLTPASLHPG